MTNGGYTVYMRFTEIALEDEKQQANKKQRNKKRADWEGGKSTIHNI